MKRAVIYERISDDRPGTGLGVARHDKDCRARCTTEGWDVAEVLVDNDRSAYSGRRRPGYERLLEGLKEGSWDVVVAWHPDRLHRSPRELEEFIDVVEAAGAQVVTVMAGAWDLSTATGRMTARVVGAVARHQSEQAAERIRRKHRELAEAGMPSGNGRTYGFESDLITHNPAEAAVIRQAARDVLDGLPLLRVVTNLNSAGVATATGGRWVSFTLRRILTSARTGGFREHAGRMHPAAWEPILDEVTWRRVRALLLDPERRRNQAPRSYLLTGGLATCGLCGAPLVARPKSGGRRAYVCATGAGFRGCGKIRQLAEPLELDVVGQVLDQVDAGRVPAMSDDRSLDLALSAIEMVEGSIAELASDYYVARSITKEQFQRASGELAAKLDDLRAGAGLVERARALPPKAEVLEILHGDDVVAQRPIVEYYAEAVVIDAAVRGRNFYDPSRVSVRWRA